MANPARIPDPRSEDPLDPAARPSIDPVTGEPRTAANYDRPGVVNRVETRSGGSSVIIAAVVIVLAVVAYFVFAPASDEGVVEAPAPAVTTEPAPAAEAPAAPADTVEPAAPAAEAPADTTAPAPDATAPEAPADSTAPAPAEPAPAQ
jgi:hypothetical protein